MCVARPPGGLPALSGARAQKKQNFFFFQKIKGKGEEMKILLMSKEKKKKVTWPPTCPRKSETVGCCSVPTAASSSAFSLDHRNQKLVNRQSGRFLPIFADFVDFFLEIYLHNSFA